MAGVIGSKDLEGKQIHVTASGASDVKIYANGAKQNVSANDNVSGNSVFTAKDASLPQIDKIKPVGNLLAGEKNKSVEDGFAKRDDISAEEAFLEMYKDFAKLQSQLIECLLSKQDKGNGSSCGCDKNCGGQQAANNPFDINGDGNLDKAELAAMMTYAAAKNGEKAQQEEGGLKNPFEKEFDFLGTGLGEV